MINGILMEGKVRKHNSNLYIDFNERGDNFSLDVPHYNRWISIINFLKKRGFKVKQNQFYNKEYKILSKYHKIGFKKDVVVLLEICPASIHLSFTNIKNLWDNQQSYWTHESDSRYTKLSYLENKAVELEIYRIIKYFENHDFEIQLNTKLSPEQYIIKQNKDNKHVHGDISTLEEIRCKSYQYNKDKNKNELVCGELKYFYDYNKRLNRGIVYHNINNMWWVICNGDLHNEANFDLFDYSPELPKKLIKESYLNNILKKFEGKRDYYRCMKINEFIKRKHGQNINL